MASEYVCLGLRFGLQATEAQGEEGGAKFSQSDRKPGFYFLLPSFAALKVAL